MSLLHGRPRPLRRFAARLQASRLSWSPWGTRSVPGSLQAWPVREATSRASASHGFRQYGRRLANFPRIRPDGRSAAASNGMFVPRWSVFLEYNFMGFGTRSATVVGCGGTCAFSGKADIQNVLA